LDIPRPPEQKIDGRQFVMASIDAAGRHISFAESRTLAVNEEKKLSRETSKLWKRS